MIINHHKLKSKLTIKNHFLINFKEITPIKQLKFNKKKKNIKINNFIKFLEKNYQPSFKFLIRNITNKSRSNSKTQNL